MDTLEVLQQARALISDPARWTQDAPARNADGQRVEPFKPEAVCWCAWGALDRAVWDTGFVAPGHGRALAHLIRELGLQAGQLGTFNDTHIHAEVLALFDKAIQRLESAAAP
jgi:hypothetical protein